MKSFLWEPRVTLSYDFSQTALEARPHNIFSRKNGSNDVDSHNNVPFAVKIATFHTLGSPGTLKDQTLAISWTWKMSTLFGLHH